MYNYFLFNFYVNVILACPKTAMQLQLFMSAWKYRFQSVACNDHQWNGRTTAENACMLFLMTMMLDNHCCYISR